MLIRNDYIEAQVDDIIGKTVGSFEVVDCISTNLERRHVAGQESQDSQAPASSQSYKALDKIQE